MEYRKLPHGSEMISTLGLGMGGIQNCSADEIQAGLLGMVLQAVIVSFIVMGLKLIADRNNND